MGGGGKNSSGGRNYKPGSDGYFGRVGRGRFNKKKESRKKVREMPGGLKGAKKFFEDRTKGYVREGKIGDKGGKRRDMPDGEVVILRPKSTSGPPAVDINRSKTVKNQKVHFPDDF